MAAPPLCTCSVLSSRCVFCLILAAALPQGCYHPILVKKLKLKGVKWPQVTGSNWQSQLARSQSRVLSTVLGFPLPLLLPFPIVLLSEPSLLSGGFGRPTALLWLPLFPVFPPAPSLKLSSRGLPWMSLLSGTNTFQPLPQALQQMTAETEHRNPH